MGILSDAQGLPVRGQIVLNFKHIQDFIVVLLTSNNGEDPIKNKGVGVLTRLFINFRHSRVANSVVGDRIWPKFELTRALMVVLVTCKNEKDPIKHEDAEIETCGACSSVSSVQ